MMSIAAAADMEWEALWNDPSNAALREARREPGVLLPGDLVTLPPRPPREGVTLRVGGTNRMRAHVRRVDLRLALEQDGRPRANVRYTVIVGVMRREGTTDGHGYLTEAVPAHARQATLILHGEDGVDDSFMLELGGLDPVETPSGLQARLRQLGYDAEPSAPENSDGGPSAGQGSHEADALHASRLSHALRRFQRAECLQITGAPNDETRTILRERSDQNDSPRFAPSCGPEGSP
jgi:hypothetical protein